MLLKKRGKYYTSGIPIFVREFLIKKKDVEKTKLATLSRRPWYGYLDHKDKIYKNISIISKICKTKKIELLIESNMSPNEFFYLKKKIKSDNFYFLFDTGNRVLLKKNLVTDIYKFNKEIKHVHLKDKNLKDKNVIFGNGEVKFVPIFKALKKINYKGSFTIESQRGKDIINQATQNYIFFKKLINQYLNK